MALGDDRLAIDELLQGDESRGFPVELSIQCRELPDRTDLLGALGSAVAVGGHCNPFVVVWQESDGDPGTKVQVGRTETVKNALSPAFVSAALVSSMDCESKRLIFEVYDEHEPNGDLKDQHFVGEASVDLAALVEAVEVGHPVTLKLTNERRDAHGDDFGLDMVAGKMTALAADGIGKAKDIMQLMLEGATKDKSNLGSITITPEHVDRVQEEVMLHINGRNLDRPKTPFGFKAAIANYFLQISRVQRNRIIPVARSNVSHLVVTNKTRVHGMNPTWHPMRCKTYRLCGRDPGRTWNREDVSEHACDRAATGCQLMMEVYDYNFVDGDKHQLIGSCRATLGQLLSGAISAIPILDDPRVGQPAYENSGELVIKHCEMLTSYSLMDYIKAGLHVDCSFAIDLTMSNGQNIESAESLHFLDPVDSKRHPNDYMSAIREVYRLVARVSHEGAHAAGLTVWGVGAQLPGDEKQFSYFPLSLRRRERKILGADRIVDTYISCLDKVTMREPTHLAPLLRDTLIRAHRSRVHAEKTRSFPAFHLLVVFTDGELDDMTECEDILVEASREPMSVILVGIGKGDRDKAKTEKPFAKMHRLQQELRSVVTGRHAVRPSAHFVSWERYKTRGKKAATETNSEFARAFFSELPSQFLAWVDHSGFVLQVYMRIAGARRQSSHANLGLLRDTARWGASQPADDLGATASSPRALGATRGQGPAPSPRGAPHSALRGTRTGQTPRASPRNASPRNVTMRGTAVLRMGQEPLSGSSDGSSRQSLVSSDASAGAPQRRGSTSSEGGEGESEVPYRAMQDPAPCACPTGVPAGRGAAPGAASPEVLALALEALQRRKEAAVAAEDFDTALELKERIAALSEAPPGQLRHTARVDQAGVSAPLPGGPSVAGHAQESGSPFYSGRPVVVHSLVHNSELNGRRGRVLLPPVGSHSGVGRGAVVDIAGVGLRTLSARYLRPAAAAGAAAL
eukprot:TRINITY_DN16952_c1_g1_i2.p1 TRINITY_DN16952_c1_g1~~TRINITY_DN16952_c1_g1_i2.p1  ORF type:complete len:971 (+),score=243.85 TRINITY_DN16952_c1_g1_i2:44-2956(+)